MRWYFWRSEINIDYRLIQYIRGFCSSPLPIFKLSLQVAWIDSSMYELSIWCYLTILMNLYNNDNGCVEGNHQSHVTWVLILYKVWNLGALTYEFVSILFLVSVMVCIYIDAFNIEMCHKEWTKITSCECSSVKMCYCTWGQLGGGGGGGGFTCIVKSPQVKGQWGLLLRKTCVTNAWIVENAWFFNLCISTS